MWTVESVLKPVEIDYPRGLYTARVDDKGRLKLPADFFRYLQDVKSTTVFVTSFDERIGRIYPISVWKEIEKHMQAPGNGGKSLMFLANDNGVTAEVDSQGRLPLPSELRKKLGVENEQVRLNFYRGGIQFFNNGVYEQERQAALAASASALQSFEDAGIL